MASSSQHAGAERASTAAASCHSRPRLDALSGSKARRLVLERRTVLCAGTDGETLRAVKSALPDDDLVIAATAYETLRTVHIRGYDLHVLELWLPDLSGFSLARDIRRVDPHVPLCLVAPSIRKQDEARVRRLGRCALVPKAVDPRELEARVTILSHAAAQSNEAAAGAARRAIDQALASRFDAMGSEMFRDDVREALKRSTRRKAKEAFFASGGMLVAFERAWDALWMKGLSDVA